MQECKTLKIKKKKTGDLIFFFNIYNIICISYIFIIKTKDNRSLSLGQS